MLYLGYGIGCGGCADRIRASRDGDGDGDGDGQEEKKDRRKMRRAFLESSYLPFASFLLREVGPTWLPVWDRSPGLVAKNDDINMSRASTTPSGSPAASGDSVGVAVIGNHDGISAAATGGSARKMFESFFRPPAVPPSLALLALCESLGKQRPEDAITQPLPFPSSQHIGKFGDVWQQAERNGGAVVGVASPDARTVQHVCRLLEPYIKEDYMLLPTPEEPPMPLRNARTLGNGSEGTINNSNGTETVTERGAFYKGSYNRTAQNTECKQQKTAVRGNLNRGCGGGDSSGGPSLLVDAVMELAWSSSNNDDGGAGGATAENRSDNCEEDQRKDLPPLVGGYAAENLVSVLCHAPQRVANSLGPIAPPDFAPAIFFSAVCRAVVHATLLHLRTVPAAFGEAAASQSVRESSGSILTGNDVSHERSKAGRSTGEVDGCGTFDTGATGDVWRAFSERLLTAGRASDLAEAWLQAMVAGKKEEEEDEGSEQQRLLLPTNHSVTVTATQRSLVESNAAVAASWETWADGSTLPEAHSWMMTRLPASRRKPFTEALLRALWPRPRAGHRHRRHPQQGSNHGEHREQALPWDGWPPGFPKAACRVLVGRPLLLLPLPSSPSRPRHGAGNGQPKAEHSEGDDGGDDGETEGLISTRRERGEKKQQQSGPAEYFSLVGLDVIEGLLLQRPLPHPAADAVADTLAWCDRRCRSTAVAVAGRGAGVFGKEKVGGVEKDGGGLVMGGLKRVAAVWAEPSFLNRAPQRQQEFYTRFLLAALRR